MFGGFFWQPRLVQVRKNLWRPRVKLLTEAEYQEQSNLVTRRALEELRR